MEWTTRAFSYVRFSSKIQERGDSVRRQDQAALDLCQRHGLMLDTTLSLRDLKTSGWNGDNLKGDLGAFLELLKLGKVPQGSTLIIEKFDRLSRQHPMTQLPLIDLILRSGVRIATTSPDRFYTHDDITANPYVVYEILSHAMSGYEESQKKSVRCGEAWSQKRKDAAKGKALTKQVPGWLTVEGEKTDAVRTIKPVEERVAIVRRIFTMADQGMGSPKIAKTLNAEGVPSFTGKVWGFAYITKLTQDRRVLGEHQSYRDKRKTIPIGEAIPDYLPRVIDQDLFDRVQVGRQTRRKNKQGREEKGAINVFRGLLTDAKTNGGIGLFTYTDRRNGNVKKQSRLIVRAGHDSGRGYEMSFKYDVFEQAFFAFVEELDPADFSTARAADAERLASLSAALTLVGEKIEVTKAKMSGAKDAKSFGVYQDSLVALLGEKEATKVEYDRQRMRLASPAVEGFADTRTMIGLISSAPDPDALRLKIRARLRQLVSTVYVLFWDADGGRHALAQVGFPDGTKRYFLTGYSLSRKPFRAVEIGSERIRLAWSNPDLGTLNALESVERDRQIQAIIDANRAKVININPDAEVVVEFVPVADLGIESV